MMCSWRVVVLTALLGAAPIAAAEDGSELVGSVTKVEGAVEITRGDAVIPVEKGTRLFRSDVITTAKEGSVGIVLRDDTTLSLGPKSELKMSEFEFKPDEGILGMTLSMAKGVMVFISGQISKLSPGSAKIETPSGVAAVRGTEVLVEVKGR